MKVKDLIEKIKDLDLDNKIMESEIIFTLKDTYNDDRIQWSELSFDSIVLEDLDNLVNIRLSD